MRDHSFHPSNPAFPLSHVHWVDELSDDQFDKLVNDLYGDPDDDDPDDFPV